MKLFCCILAISFSSNVLAASAMVCSGKAMNLQTNEVVSKELNANITDDKHSISIEFGSLKYFTDKLTPPDFDGKYYPSGITSEGNIIQRIDNKHYRFIQMSQKEKVDLFCK